MEGGDKEESKEEDKPVSRDNLPKNKTMPGGFSEQKDLVVAAGASGRVAQYPEQDWFLEWKKTLNIANIKACVSHTYNKAMHIRNQMIEQDPSLSSL